MARTPSDPAFDPNSVVVREIRAQIAERDGWRCRYCGRTGLVEPPRGRGYNAAEAPYITSLDHWLPRAKGGNWEPSNLVLACAKCNTEKGHLTGDEYLAVIAYRRRQAFAGSGRQPRRCRPLPLVGPAVRTAMPLLPPGRSAARTARRRHCRRPSGGTPQHCWQP